MWTVASTCYRAGEYILYQKQDKYTLRGCTIKDAFYDLRCDYDRLACSVFISFDKSRFGLRVSPVDTLNVVKPPVFARTVLRSRYSLAYPQAQSLADHKIPPIIDNPYKNPDSPYKYTGSEVREEDYEWLRHDVSILMRSLGRAFR